MQHITPTTARPIAPPITPTLAIIGAGKVGRVMAQQFFRHGVFTIQDILNRSIASSTAACHFIGSGNPIASITSMRRADIVMLAVSDDQIHPVSLALQRHDLLHPNCILFHCSGALCASELDWHSTAINDHRGGVASLHPVRSFADPSDVAASFPGTLCSLEGEAPAVMRLRDALQAIGAEVVLLESAGKTLYHAAAVIANNYLVTLMDAALSTYHAAGISPEMARRMAEPLARAAIDNVFRLGPELALTGPIARGDLNTVTQHQQALNATNPAIAALYQALATATKLVAARTGRQPTH